MNVDTRRFRRIRFRQGEWIPFRVLPVGHLCKIDGVLATKLSDTQVQSVQTSNYYNQDPAALVKNEQDFFYYESPRDCAERVE